MIISKAEVEELTKKLISFPSITGESTVYQCAEYICKWFMDIDINAEIVTNSGVPNVIARVGNKNGKRLLLNGHFDVVPEGDRKEWNTNPFEGVIKEGFIYGRGSSDMKSGVAANMLAMKQLKKIEKDLNGEIVFYGIGDEEAGSVHGTIELLEKYDKNFQASIVAEPSDFCIERAQRGLRWIEFSVKGKACHAGRPHIGKNAIEQTVKIINQIKKLEFDAYNDIFEDGLKAPSLSVNKIQGGIRNNIIAEECSFIIDRRLIPGEAVDDCVKQIKDVADSVLEDGFSYEMNLVNNGWDPFITNADEPLVIKLIESYKEVAGKDPVVRGKGGCTDASHIHNAGIPVVILGPGNANESHTANEKTEIDKIVMTSEIIYKTILKFL